MEYLKDTYRVHASTTVAFSAYETALQITRCHCTVLTETILWPGLLVDFSTQPYKAHLTHFLLKIYALTNPVCFTNFA